MTIVTKTGDDGTTSTLRGVRVAKNDSLIELTGTVDEFNESLGLARSLLKEAGILNIAQEVHEIQATIFRLGADVQGGAPTIKPISAKDITVLEDLIIAHEGTVELPRTFVISGATPAAAALGVARTVARRAERRALLVAEKKSGMSDDVRIWLNRVADYLFIAARAAEHAAGVEPDIGD